MSPSVSTVVSPVTSKPDIAGIEQAARAAGLASGLTWLDEVRASALADFARRGFPTGAEEDWRYTDIGPAAATTLERAARPLERSTDLDALLAALPALGETAALVVLENGVLRRDLSRWPTAAGLQLTPWSEADAAARARIAAALDGRAWADSSSLVSLNTSLLRDGLEIAVTAGEKIATPIHIVHVGGAGAASQARLLVQLEAGSSATVIEHHVSRGDSVSNTVTGLQCAAGARLTYVKLQSEADAATHLATQQLVLHEDSRADLLHLDVGAKLARNDLAISLAGRGAMVSAHGLFFADGARHLDNHTRIDHRAPHTTSREIYRGIADGHGRGVFNGKVLVHPAALKTDARLNSQNLLLSKTAEIDTKPELEIYADDVKCSHGATTGQLDGNAVFYLRSRGIPESEARRMLIASFVQEIVRQLPSAALVEHVIGLMQDRLPELRDAGSQS